jgi:sulfatase maturation enzyme AslB (radical SAM superfamily)
MKIELSHFTFIVTDDCNFNCSYCFQEKEKKYMKHSAVEKAVEFFYPFFQEDVCIGFYGGEPLLAFDTVKYAVSLLKNKDKIEKKGIRFLLTTNGSLLTAGILDFCNRYGFSLMLSFDGASQDFSREPGTRSQMQELVREMHRYPGIELSINSVFSPRTVDRLSESLRSIIQCGGIDINFDLSTTQPWDDTALCTLEDELAQLSTHLSGVYKETGKIPVENFRPPGESTGGVFYCSAGQNRMAVTPGETLWGCFLFHDYLKRKQDSSDYRSYCFGDLDDFIRNHETLYPQIVANYSHLKQDMFFRENQHCFLCRELEYCRVCPVNAAYSTSFIGKIPPWICSLNKIEKRQKSKFLNKIGYTLQEGNEEEKKTNLSDLSE